MLSAVFRNRQTLIISCGRVGKGKELNIEINLIGILIK